jgi:hypothetical protein
VNAISMTYGVSALALLGGASSSLSSVQAATPPTCVPRGAQLLAASQTTAVFRWQEKVIACGPGTSARTLVTEHVAAVPTPSPCAATGCDRRTHPLRTRAVERKLRGARHGALQHRRFSCSGLGRSESCPYASTDALRATGGQRMPFELRPALAPWCQTKGLKASLTLEFGRDAGPNGPLPHCAGRPTPCGGELDVGRTLLAASPSAPLGAARLARVGVPGRAAGRI